MIARLVVALVALGLVAGPALAAPRAGEPAPAFSVSGASGGTLSAAAFRGKPTYLNFFASWCAPCNEEAPSVRALYQKYRKRGFVTIGIDELENSGAATGFAKKYGWPFKIGVDGDGNALAAFGGIGLPVHVFIDRRGKISTLRMGEMDPPEIEAAIRKIL